MHPGARVGQMKVWRGPRKNLNSLFKLISTHVSQPSQISRRDEPFKMLATTLGGDSFLGRVLTGRIESGTLKTGQQFKGNKH